MVTVHKTISEVLKELVSAGISDIVYHSTRISAAEKILKENRFALTFVHGSDDATNPKNKYYYLSTTRSKLGSYHLGDRLGVLFKLDGTKLRNKYIGNPVDYWGREFRKIQPSRNEMEDRVWSDDPFIEPADKYIAEMHVFYVDAEDASDAIKKTVRQLLIEAKRKGIPTYLYTDLQAAKLLDTRKAIPLTKINLKTEAEKPQREYGSKDDLAPWLELYEKNKKEYLSKEPWGGAVGLLDSLRSMDGIESFKCDIHNNKTGTPALHKIAEILKKKDWKMSDFYKHLQEKWHGYSR